MLENKYRFAILGLTTLCLSMMLANILTLNFTMMCMTEEKFHWENFTIDLGYDVFEKVDFDPPKVSDDVPATEVEVPESSFPDFEIPGVKVPRPGFNWQTFNLAKTNPDLFFSVMKKIIKQISIRVAERTGEALDPRNIDFEKYRNGFNLSDISPNVVYTIKYYMLDKVRAGRQQFDLIDAEVQNLTAYRELEVRDVELVNITWNGQVNGRIRVVDRPADYYYTDKEKAILFAAVAVGAIIFLFPVTRLLRKIGTRKTFTLVSVVSAISTGLVPLFASFGFIPFIVIRMVQGIGFAACFPVIGSVTSSWAKLTENGLFNGALTGFLQLGPVIAMPLSGLFCHLDFWEGTFYLHSLVTILLTVIFWVVFRDTPREHKKVTTVENSEIQAGKVIVDGRTKHNRAKTPIKEIYTTRSVIAIWVAAVGNMGGVFLIMFAPIFIREVLQYPVIFVGFQAALPTLLQFIVKLKAGALSDYLKKPETFKVKLFNSIAFFGMAFFFILIAFIASRDTQVISIVLLVLSATVLGFNTGGFFKASTLVSRQYSYFVNAHVQLIACLALLLDPVVIYTFAPTNSQGGWGVVFIFFAVLLIVSNVVFLLLGSGEPAPFTGELSSDLHTNGEQQQMKPIIKAQA